MKTSLLLIFAFLIHSTTLFGQLEKGDWLLGSENQYSVLHSTFLSSSINSSSELRLSESIGYMLSNRVMLGMDFALNERFESSSSGSKKNKSYTYFISPFVRYYLNNGKKTLPFIEFKAIKKVFGYDWSNNKSNNDHYFKTELGLGLQYSIAPNIVLETMIGTKISDSEEMNFNTLTTEKFHTNIGIRTIINKKFENPIDLKKDYLKKGNYSIEGNGFFKIITAHKIELLSGDNFTLSAPRTGVDLGFSPSISYFKSDNWLVSGGVNFELIKKGGDYEYTAGLKLGSSWFIRLKEQLFFKPSVGLSYNRNVSFGDRWVAGPLPSSPLVKIRHHESTHSIILPADLGLAWFIGSRSILTNGAEFQLEYFESKNFQNSLFFRGKAYSNIEYFLAPNFSLDAQVSFLFDNKPDRDLLRSIFFDIGLETKFDFSLGFNYFVFRK